MRWSCESVLETACIVGWWTNRDDDEAAVYRRRIGIQADRMFAFRNLEQRSPSFPPKVM
jgi:hypothetical protein